MEQFNPLIKERRAAPRSLSSIPAYLLLPTGGWARGVMKNFSRAGLFLQTRTPAECSLLGQSTAVVFAIEHGNLVRLLRYRVVIRRESQHGYGLEFGRSLWSTAIFPQA
ncbi:PilZ domain-containing protein [Candidatus Methylocalor cossyra]|uniref:PilZ domain-containing protein n=1 Tax=Candidatus Methylocalor cossyra TaxID=3108543 RepID=A0ABM9NLC1_9GAMM